MANALLRCYNTWWIVCLSLYFAKLFLTATSLLRKENIQHFCFHNHVLLPMSTHVCYAMLSASAWQPHVLAVPISVVHVLVVVAHFDVVVVHFASVSSFDEEFRFFSSSHNVVVVASVSSVDEEFWFHWELRSTIKFVHHIFQCHNFSWVSFIYIFFTIDLASFLGSFPLSFLTMLFDLKA